MFYRFRFGLIAFFGRLAFFVVAYLEWLAQALQPLSAARGKVV